jgi:hypothetical protein
MQGSTPSSPGWSRGLPTAAQAQSTEHRAQRVAHSITNLTKSAGNSCFLERSQQQEATCTPSFAYYSLCMVLRRCAWAF